MTEKERENTRVSKSKRCALGDCGGNPRGVGESCDKPRGTQGGGLRGNPGSLEEPESRQGDLGAVPNR